MKKLILVSVGFLLISPSLYADDPCYSPGFREEFGDRCKRIETKHSFKWVATDEFKPLTEKIECPSFFASFTESCLDAAKTVIVNNAVDGIALDASTVKQAFTQQNKVAEKFDKVSTRLDSIEAAVPADDLAFQEEYIKSLPTDQQANARTQVETFNKTPKECAKSDSPCNGIYDSLLSFKKSEANKLRRDLSSINDGLQQTQDSINKNTDDLRKKVTGPFLAKAAKELSKKVGTKITPESFAGACQNLNSGAGLASANLSADQMKNGVSLCNKIEGEKDVIAALAKEYNKMNDEIDKEKDLAKLLGLKLDIQSESAENALLAKQLLNEKIDEKLEGTYIGNKFKAMKDEIGAVRAEICDSIANPVGYCPIAAATEQVVKDVGRDVSAATEKLSKQERAKRVKQRVKEKVKYRRQAKDDFDRHGNARGL